MDDGRTDGRRTDGPTTEHGYTISSPCEPDGSGELKISNVFNRIRFYSTALNIIKGTEHAQKKCILQGEKKADLLTDSGYYSARNGQQINGHARAMYKQQGPGNLIIHYKTINFLLQFQLHV